jgi:glutamyl-tRNA reductase
MKLLLLGMSHRSAPVEVREHYAADDSSVEAALRKLSGHSEIGEIVLISTCNRVEVVVTTQNPDEARVRLTSFFRDELGGGVPVPGGGSLEDYVYLYADQEVVGHVFRVASAIDSMVVGEPQILGQMKDAYRASVEIGSCGPILSRLFQKAFATAKRVKNETRIAQRPVSVARVAVELARQIFEELSDKKALMIGAGEMIEAALFALRREGLDALRVVNRTRARAEELAERFGASAHGLEDLDEVLKDSDIVLSCIGGSGHVLDAARVSRALASRRNHSVFLIDIGVPRNIDPAVNDLDSAYLYDIDDLQEIAFSNEEERRRESAGAEEIVLEEQERLAGWMVALRAVPTIRHLRARAEAVRQAELGRSLSKLDLSDSQAERVEALTRSIVNKILHRPLARLGAHKDREEGLAVVEEARALFGLDDPEAPGAEIDSQMMGEKSEPESAENAAGPEVGGSK